MVTRKPIMSCARRGCGRVAHVLFCFYCSARFSRCKACGGDRRAAVLADHHMRQRCMAAPAGERAYKRAERRRTAATSGGRRTSRPANVPTWDVKFLTGSVNKEPSE